jgi:thymidylate synthase
MFSFRDASEAFTFTLEKLIKEGRPVPSRLGDTRELIAHLVTIEKPQERVYFLPFRDDNIFTKIAGSWWIMSGTNDLEFLELYLPTAQERSDDNLTWRAAFGPRLR